jgi:uncharacterized Ntn-hydrolase superfamily protein
LSAATLLLATWSIVAVDPRTREVGAAAASCIHAEEFPIDRIAELVPGTGAVVAQALGNLEAKAAIAAAIARGASPAVAIAAVTAPDADEWLGLDLAAHRQYGAVTFAAGPVSFTGDWNGEWAGARAGSGVSVQGNILRGPEVLDEALAAFEAEPGKCLAERLVAALEAGARAGGDRRCVPELGSLSAFVAVAAPDEARGVPGLRLLRTRPDEPSSDFWDELRRRFRPEPGSADENPVHLLRRAWDAERAAGRAPASCREAAVAER